MSLVGNCASAPGNKLPMVGNCVAGLSGKSTDGVSGGIDDDCDDNDRGDPLGVISSSDDCSS